MRPHSANAARPQRAHGSLEDPTAFPQRATQLAVQTPGHGVVFVHIQCYRRRMAFYAIAQRAHSAYTAQIQR